MGVILQRQREAIVRRWMDRVETEVGPTGLERSQLRDAIPDYLSSLAAMLREGGSPRQHGSKWESIARSHGIARVKQGFDIRDMLHEFVLLRLVLAEVAHEHGIEGLPVLEVLTEAVEDAIECSVAAYVESRDEQARRAEAQHVAFLTHELRSPLSSAILAMQQLWRVGAVAPEHERLAAIVDRAHGKLWELIEGVLTVERGRAGELTAHPEPTRLASIIEDAVSQVMPAAEAKGLDLEADFGGELWLLLDPRLTASAVQNLLDNAVKYSGAGTVRLWVEVSPESVTLHVQDSCGGVSREELDSMFTPFRRGRHRRPGNGQGLGLAIAREAIETQGGTVHVEPVAGACHFWIRLPRKDAAAS